MTVLCIMNVSSCQQITHLRLRGCAHGKNVELGHFLREIHLIRHVYTEIFERFGPRSVFPRLSKLIDKRKSAQRAKIAWQAGYQNRNSTWP